MKNTIQWCSFLIRMPELVLFFLVHVYFNVAPVLSKNWPYIGIVLTGFLQNLAHFLSLDEKGGNSEGIMLSDLVRRVLVWSLPSPSDRLDTAQNANSTVEMRDEVG